MMLQKYDVKIFCDMMFCGEGIYTWVLENSLTLYSEKCENEKLVRALFDIDNVEQQIHTHFQTNSNPIIITSDIGFLWLACGDSIQQKEIAYIIGPIFTQSIQAERIELYLKNTIVSSIKDDFIQLFRKLPSVPLLQCMKYGIMLHYCISGQKIVTTDIQFSGQSEKIRLSDTQKEMSHGTWVAEQELLKFVQEGNLNYHQALERLRRTGAMGKLVINNPLRESKTAVIIFVTLCSRAAIKGGLSPEVGLALSDTYFQSIEECTQLETLKQISNNMIDDYIRRVNKIKQNKDVSKAVQTCIDYILIHLCEPISLKALAKEVGYTEYYLSKKFKKEIGISVLNYLHKERIKRATLFLRSTNKSVLEISEILHFSSSSYFSSIFKKETSFSPAEFRNNLTISTTL